MDGERRDEVVRGKISGHGRCAGDQRGEGSGQRKRGQQRPGLTLEVAAEACAEPPCREVRRG